MFDAWVHWLPTSHFWQRAAHPGHDPRRAKQRWFTEGFDTRDLKEAKALLEQLAI
jgi:hypothetical protein